MYENRLLQSLVRGKIVHVDPFSKNGFYLSLIRVEKVAVAAIVQPLMPGSYATRAFMRECAPPLLS